MKLHVKDVALTVHDLELNDYAKLDVDHDLTVNNEIPMDGFLIIDVADGATLAAVDLSFDGDLAELDLKASTSGPFSVDSATLDARGTGEHRQLLLHGGTLTLGSSGVDGTVTMYSDRDVNDNRGKFWVESGSLVWDAQAAARELRFVGGPSYIRRADIDLDVDMTIPTSNGHLVVEGWARIDIAVDKTLKAPKLTVGDPFIDSRLHILSKEDAGTLDVSNY